MSKDLLEQFRGQSAGNKVLPGPARVAYEAFHAAATRQPRLKLRPRLRAWERINYGYLYRIVEDGFYGTQIGLVYSFAVVVIRGRNLQPIADAIDAELCERVVQFDADRWELPVDAKAPVVDAMEFHVQTRVEASDQLLQDIEGTQRAGLGPIRNQQQPI